MQIRTRLTIQFAAVVFSFLLISFGLVYYFTYRYNRDQFRERLSSRAITTARLLNLHVVDSTLLTVIDHTKTGILFGESVTIYDKTGREIYANNDTVSFSLPSETLRRIHEQGSLFFKYGNYQVSAHQLTDKEDSYVVISGAIDVVGHELMNNLLLLLLGLLLVAMVVVLFAGWEYAGRALHPINVLINEVQSISEDDLQRRLKEPKGRDEIAKLIRIFNGLLTRIEKAFDLERSFVSNVSHELKNPLTRITSQLEVTLLNARSNEEYRETLESVLEDVRELNLLATSLLDLASKHQSTQAFAMSSVRVDEAMWDAMERVSTLNPQYRAEVVNLDLPESEEDLCSYGSPHLLRSALINIIENACKFSNDHTARISLSCSNHSILIRVSDRGPGISDADLKNIFQPFYRGNQGTSTKGHGVGLWLSKRIFRLYEGDVTIQSKVGEGTEVLATLKTKQNIRNN